MIQSKIQAGTVVVSSSNKYVAYYNGIAIELTETKTKNKVYIDSVNTSMVAIFDELGILLYSNMAMEFVIYDISQGKKIKATTTFARILKVDFVIPG